MRHTAKFLHLGENGFVHHFDWPFSYATVFFLSPGMHAVIPNIVADCLDSEKKWIFQKMSEFPHFHLPVEKYYTHEDTSGQPPFMYFNQGNQVALEIGTNFELKDISKRSRTPLKEPWSIIGIGRRARSINADMHWKCGHNCDSMVYLPHLETMKSKIMPILINRAIAGFFLMHHLLINSDFFIFKVTFHTP